MWNAGLTGLLNAHTCQSRTVQPGSCMRNKDIKRNWVQANRVGMRQRERLSIEKDREGKKSQSWKKIQIALLKQDRRKEQKKQ